jgi:hypothetical protein
MLKVGDQKLNVFGLQLLAPKVRDPELGAICLQLLMSKVETQELSPIHLFLEKKFCLNRSCLKNLNEKSEDQTKQGNTSFI